LALAAGESHPSVAALLDRITETLSSLDARCPPSRREGAPKKKEEASAGKAEGRP